MGKLRDAINKRLKRKKQDADKKRKDRDEVSIHDPKTGKKFHPSDRREAAQRAEALAKKINIADSNDLDNSIMKSMSDRLNNAENEEEAAKLKARLDKYKDSMSKKD